MKFYCYFRFSSPFLPFPFAFLSHSRPLGTSSFSWTFFLCYPPLFFTIFLTEKETEQLCGEPRNKSIMLERVMHLFPTLHNIPLRALNSFPSLLYNTTSIYHHRYQLRPSLFYSPSNGLHLTTDGRIRRYLVISRYGYDFSWRNVFLFSRENSISRSIWKMVVRENSLEFN